MSRRHYLNVNQVPAGALDRDLIFDTSVWLSIYGLESENRSARTLAYSNFYKRALEAGRSIYLLSTIVSEYVNRSLKIREHSIANKSLNVKIHQHRLYVDWMTSIGDEVKFLADDCNRLSDSFDVDDPEELCRRCIGKAVNFNDMLISQACQRHSLVLATDDKDFSGEHIDVVTFNRNLT